MNGIVGILLAAGAARRFGAPKLMQPLADGTPIGVAAARALVAALPQAIAVVRPGNPELTEALAATGLRIVAHPLAENGMGASLAAGVDAAAEADGWLIALADMPWIRPATIRTLADTLRDGAAMVAPVYDNQRGHPVGFATRWREQLRSLQGDRGARDLLAAHSNELVLLPTEDAGVLADVDNPGDLGNF